MAKVTVRKATQADLPPLAQISALANTDDPVDNYLYPHHHTHPKSYTSLYHSRLKITLRNPFAIIDVTVLSDSSDIALASGFSREVVVGYALYYRETSTPSIIHQHNVAANMTALQKVKVWLKDFFSRPPVFRLCAGLRGQWHDFMFDRYMSRAEELEPPEYFDLDILCVHPSYQRRGIGKTLMKHGLQRAREEGVEVWLCASVMGQGLYEKCGFEGVGWLQWGPGSAEPEPVGRSCPRMRWRPEENEREGGVGRR